MDEFTVKYLKEWGFDYLVSRFKEEEIDRMAFLDLTESMVARLIPKMGPQSKFLKLLQKLREEIQRDKEIASTESSISASGTSDSLNLIDIGNIANFEILTTQENFNALAAEKLLPTTNSNLGQYINDILNKYQDGLMILDYYNVHKNLL